ncbi:MAG: alkaline phosphatase D family protein [Rhodopila sp.]
MPSVSLNGAWYYNKYLENVSGVDSVGNKTATGQQGLQNMLAATGTYTLLDNHELGNQSLQSGGASLAAGSRVTPSQGFDVNTTGAYDNQTSSFKTLQKAFFDYHPTKASLDANLNSTGPTVNNPADPRSNGTPIQYFAQQQGKNVLYMQLDDSTYRDARLGKQSGTSVVDDVTSGRQNNPNRTMLGSTQLSWVKQTLLDAQAAGTPWKFIAISTPIDQTGPAQDGKSWYGGYAAERNELLKFIADNNISNVVFLTTDDHLTRMNALTYEITFGDPSTTKVVPGTFRSLRVRLAPAGPTR